MNKLLSIITEKYYIKCGLKILNLVCETESLEYDPCRFQLNGLQLVCRNAKITPKKVGQFVAFWKRNGDGLSIPLSDNDVLDYYLINVRKNKRLGQFIIPKHVLINKAIISTNTKQGKRGFRLYPPWDTTTSKQAKITQQWQLEYFIELNSQTDYTQIIKLYGLSIDICN